MSIIDTVETEEWDDLPLPVGEPAVGDCILGPDGPLAVALPAYEARRPQIDMANLIEQVLGRSGAALIEAGTGTGKSLAYLIPAILSGEKVVVSTDTIALQEQLVRKDLPFLARVLDRPFTFAIAKGRSNFFCLRNAKAYANEYAKTDRPGAWEAERLVSEFESGRWSGDKSALKVHTADSRWSVVCGDESCTGQSCEHAAVCPYLAAKERWENADVVVTNHTMYLLHHALLKRTRGTAGCLPGHTVWIGDEAHTLPDRACDMFGVTLRDRAPAALVKRLARQAKVLGLRLDLPPDALETVRTAGERFFSTFHGATKQEQLLSAFPPEIVSLARQRMDTLAAALKPLRVSLYWACAQLDETTAEGRKAKRAVERLYDQIDELIEGLIEFFGEPLPFRTVPAECRECDGAGILLHPHLTAAERPCPLCHGKGGLEVTLDPEVEEDRDWVRFAEVSGSGLSGKEVTLHVKPIETGPIFQQIRAELNASIYCSATLATGLGAGAWKPVAADLGLDLEETRTLQVESPFDYSRQVTGYIPPALPGPGSPEYHTALSEEVVKILNHTQGRAFILFTSNWDMRKVYELVVPQVRFPILLQGTADKNLLLEEFKSTPNAVLFGVKTFWAGVDIPGDQLSCVVLVKLPFPQPQHPLNEARCARIEQRGGNGFRDFMLPHCIQDTRQGFGRLIRTKTDIGLFVILDPRMRTARYGRTIADSLPSFRCKGVLE